MLLPVLRSAVVAATLSLAALAASAQTFGEFLSKPELPVTLLGADFSAARYYGPPGTVSAAEMQQQFSKINELLVQEASKYDIGGALRRPGKVTYTINVTEAENKHLDGGTLIVPSDKPHRPAFTAQTVQERVRRYDLPAGATGVGLAFVVEDIDKLTEQEAFWITFVNLRTKQVLYTTRFVDKGLGFGFRNHWAHPFYKAIKDMEDNYGKWQKEFAKK